MTNLWYTVHVDIPVYRGKWLPFILVQCKEIAVRWLGPAARH